MKKQKMISEKHYYSMFFFLFIIAYSCTIPGELSLWKVDKEILSFHAVDYSFGFCSRFLPGAIYKLICGAANETKINIYMTVLMVIFFAVLSIFLEKFILTAQKEYRKTALIVLLFLITGPATFSIFVKVMGMLEVYWVFAAALFLVLLSRKSTYAFFFIPFLICVLTYYVTWLCYIPLFAILILYKISVSDTKKEKAILWCSLIFSVVLASGLTVYLVLFEKGNLTYDINEFIKIFDSMGIDGAAYEQSLYYYNNGAVVDNMGSGSIFDELMVRIALNLETSIFINKIPLFILISPIVVFIYSFFFKRIRSSEDKLKSLSYLCMVLLFAGTMVAAFITTTDLIRWTGHAFLPLFISFLYVLYNEGDTAWASVKEQLDRYSFKAIAVYFVLYACVVYDPYFI